MKQSVFGLPSVDVVPKGASTAFQRLTATIRSAGWTAISAEEARGQGAPYLELVHTRFQPVPIFGEASLSDEFEIQALTGNGVSIRYGHSLSLGLEEIRRQFVAIHVEGVQESFQPMRWRPKAPLRAVRIDRNACLRDSIVYDLEKFAEFGINAVLVDALDPPSSNGVLVDECHAAGWEPRLRHTLEVIGKRGLWRAPVLPLELDLATEASGGGERGARPLCRQDPRGRRRLLHRFESLVRMFPKVEAFGLTIAQWDRCDCEMCRRTSFQEEAAYYLRAYFAVLKRYAPETALWILPDEYSWEALQEVGPQVPEPVRWLYTSEPGRAEVEKFDWERNPDGVQFTLDGGAREGFLDPAAFGRLDGAGGSDRDPQLAVVRADFSGAPPVQFAAFLRSMWEVQGNSEYLEEWLYRLALPSTEWKNWRSWKADNDLMKRCWTEGARNGPAGSWVTKNGSAATCNGKSNHVKNENEASGLQSRVADLARRNGRTPYSLSPGPHLIHDLVAGANRWLAESDLKQVLKGLDSMPETAPVDGKLAGRIADLRDGLNEFLESPHRLRFGVEELRGVESLRDHLGLLLSRERRREVWDKKDLPLLWIDR